jgi:hypothetical protein
MVAAPLWAAPEYTHDAARRLERCTTIALQRHIRVQDYHFGESACFASINDAIRIKRPFLSSFRGCNNIKSAFIYTPIDYFQTIHDG